MPSYWLGYHLHTDMEVLAAPRIFQETASQERILVQAITVPDIEVVSGKFNLAVVPPGGLALERDKAKRAFRA